MPYLIGWTMGIVGPGNPRWFLLLGILVGLWYLALCGIVISRPSRESTAVLAVVLAAVGLTALGGCLVRLASAARQSRITGPAPAE